jgi:(p)ppGpp synthase/HD superfamily hydrolase
MHPDYLIQSAIELVSTKLAHLHDEPKPTLLHCIRVGTYLYEHNYPINVILGGYLHDIIEDSDVTYDDLVRDFGTIVADLVLANTADDTLPKAEKKQEVVTRCITHSPEATIIMATEILEGYTNNMKNITVSLPDKGGIAPERDGGFSIGSFTTATITEGESFRLKGETLSQKKIENTYIR